MAITFIRAAESNPTVAATSHTMSFNAVGVDCIVVGARDAGTTSIISSVTFNGQSFTLADHRGTDQRGTSVYVLFAPSQVSGTITINYTTSLTIGAIAAGFAGGTFTLGNVNGRADSTASGGSGANVVLPITSLAGSMVVDFLVVTKSTLTVAPTPNSPQTNILGHLDGGGFAYNRMSYSPAATGMSWTMDGPSLIYQAHSAIELRATAGTPTVTSVDVSPATATVSGGSTQTFTATVVGTGGPSQSVTWSASAGSITSGGVFTAPAASGSIQTITVTATSVADNTKSGTATVTVPATAATVTSVTVSPSTASVTGGASQTFTATVNGTGSPSQSVTWSASSGSITSGGVFTAPTATGSIQTVTITATSVADNTKSGTATATIPASTVPVLSASYLSKFGTNFSYADRVKESSTTTGTGAVTLAGAAFGFRAFNPTLSVGAKLIPYVIELSSAGQWEVGLGTLTTATTLTRDTVLSSSNAGSLVNFSAGSKDVFCAVPAASLKRMAVKRSIDLRDYDVDPTFTNDSTAGIQAAINDAFLSGIQRIDVPVGRYKIAGPRLTVDGFGRPCNGQIYFPASDHVASMKSIQLIGESKTNWGYGGINDEPITDGGVIFESTLTAGGGDYPGVFCASYGYSGGFGNFNFTDVTMENICVRTNTLSGANKMCGINLYDLANGGFLDNVKVEVNRGLATNPDPTGIGSFGIVTARTNNSGAFKWGKVFVGGYETGVRIFEHMCIDRLTVYGCVNAVDLQQTNHASNITHLNVENCRNSIVINGGHDLSILCYATEHKSIGRWQDTQYDIKYVTGTRKVAIVQSTVIQAGSAGGNDSAWLTNDTGGTHYKVIVGAGAN